MCANRRARRHQDGHNGIVVLLSCLHGFGLTPFEEIRRKRVRPSEIIENPQTLGEHLKRARQIKRIRQKDAAMILGVGQFTYMTWEKDQKFPTVRYFPAIVLFVGYDPLPEPQTEGERMRRRRWLFGLTSLEMADVDGCDQGTLLKLEREKIGRAHV